MFKSSLNDLKRLLIKYMGSLTQQQLTQHGIKGEIKQIIENTEFKAWLKKWGSQ